jgi:hypothetical protein
MPSTAGDPNHRLTLGRIRNWGSGGVLFANKGLLVFGTIFLGEEFYETGVVLLALRAGLKAAR